MRTGRPTKYRPEMCEKVIEFMAQGYSKEATAAHLEISKDTLYAYIEKYPEFSDAVKEGEIKSRLFWEKLGIDGVKGEIQGFNATTWIFNMKNRHGWQDKQAVEHSGQMKVKIDSKDAGVL